MTEMTNRAGTWRWAHTNVYAPGLSATYDADPTEQTEGQLYFALSDWLGTRRQQTDYAGNPCLNFTSLPYGDGLTPVSISCLSPSEDATEHHYTGKERDSESGNDYFGARYYASTMGRFLSPDYDGDNDDPEPVPYADFENPQTLNLYGYVANNPLSRTDPSGHDGDDEDGEGDGQQAGTIPLVAPIAGDGPALDALVGILLRYSPIGIGIAIGAGPSLSNPKDLDCGCYPEEVSVSPTATGTVIPMAPHKNRKGSKKRLNDKHTKPRPGTKQPPNYTPWREYQAKNKNTPKQPYFRRDRDPLPDPSPTPPPPPKPDPREVPDKPLINE
jgi:RHS repeat-associated protein